MPMSQYTNTFPALPEFEGMNLKKTPWGKGG